jgi:hypothetical protein
MKINAMPYFHLLRRYALLAAGMLVMISFFSCNSAKRLNNGEYLLNKNKIIYRFGAAQKNKGITTITNIGKEGIEKFEIPQRIAPSEVLPYVKQKPNTKIIFIFPFYLDLYNLPDSAKTARRAALKDSAYVVKALKKGWTKEKLKKRQEESG